MVNGVVGYEIYVRAAGGVGFSDIPQVATPTIENNKGVVTLSCETDGAAIWYSTNKSNPSPRNGKFYTGPFVVAETCTVTCRAYVDYWSTSCEASLLIDPTQGDSYYDLIVTGSPPSIVPIVGVGQWRTLKGQRQSYNSTTQLWHTVGVSGDPPQIVWSQTGVP